MNEANALVSIVMPCYNDGKYIEESVASAKAQTWPNTELIIADDGSDDPHTVEVLRTLEARGERVLHLSHRGLPGARNAAIAAAGGSYILPLDSDDLIEPTYIEQAVAVLERDKTVGVVYCHADLFGEESGPWKLPEFSLEQMLYENVVFATALYRKSDWQAVHGYREDMRAGLEDYDLWLSFLEMGRAFVCLPETLFHYRRKPGSMSKSLVRSAPDVLEAFEKIYANHVGLYEAHAKEYALSLRRKHTRLLYIDHRGVCEAHTDICRAYDAQRSQLAERNNLLAQQQNQIAQQSTVIAQQQAQMTQQSTVLAQQRSQLAEMEADAEICRGQLEKLQAEVDACRHEIQEYSNLVARERGEAAKTAAAYQMISTSTFWKLTKPARMLLDLFKKLFIFPLRKVRQSIKTVGKRETLRKIKRKLTGAPQPAPAPQAFAAASVDARRNPVTLDPVDGIETISVDEDVKRLNLVTDTIDASSLLGGVATALIVATEFANRNGYELRIITRKTETNPANYQNIMRISGIEPARKLSFYSDYERFSRPVDFRMELGRGEIFFATSWWSAQAIKNTTVRPRFFYIIQEVETFFYNYGGERLLCEQIMNDPNVDFIINSHYLHDYFAQHTPNITDHGCYFEPAFPAELYSRKVFTKKEKYKLFFYARPNNPRNLYAVGVEILKAAVDRGILNMDEWDVYCVGQNAPVIHFSTGKDSVNMGQLSWEEYAEFLTDVDLGLCLMYTPHPSYPPFDVASSGGVVLTNKMLNKQTFDLCDNVIMAELEEEAFMKGFEQAVALAKDTERRRKNYEANTIPRSWQRTLDGTMAFMEERCGNV